MSGPLPLLPSLFGWCIENEFKEDKGGSSQVNNDYKQEILVILIWKLTCFILR